MIKSRIFAGMSLAGILVTTAFGAEATTKSVCASGCTSTTIQGGIDAAAPGDTVAVSHGTYVENIVIGKSLNLVGDNQNSTKIVPAISNPNCDGAGGGSLCSGGSNIILVEADNVTISGFTLDGDNPALTSGVSAGGANLDARNGIITNHHMGTFNNLVVHDVTVKNVYLRGMYASSGGTFNFHDNTVQNVQADLASVAMFNHGGSGAFTNNSVSQASDAISANYSSGTRFLNNSITQSASGVHTDNAGLYGGIADIIQGNSVDKCTAGGYGVWVFVPYLSPSVEKNDVHGCSVGLALFGGFSGTPVAFDGNSVNNFNGADSVSALVTSDMVGYGCSDAKAVFTGNTLKNSAIGVQLLQGPAFPGDLCPSPYGNPNGSAKGTISATLHMNNIFGDTTGIRNQSGNTIDASNNWWGCSKGPNTTGCDNIVDSGGSTTNYTPWLTKPAH